MAALDAPAGCREPITEACTVCGHEAKVLCHVQRSRAASGVQLACKNKVAKQCTRCKINEVMVECSKLDVQCNTAEAICTLQCGHAASWICGHEGKEGEDPRITGECIACGE
jgi:hypothetical protein